MIRIVEALGWQSTPCCSSFSSVAASTCSISTVNTPHLQSIFKLVHRSSSSYQKQSRLYKHTFWQIPQQWHYHHSSPPYGNGIGYLLDNSAMDQVWSPLLPAGKLLRITYDQVALHQERPQLFPTPHGSLNQCPCNEIWCNMNMTPIADNNRSPSIKYSQYIWEKCRRSNFQNRLYAEQHIMFATNISKRETIQHTWEKNLELPKKLYNESEKPWAKYFSTISGHFYSSEQKHSWKLNLY